MDKPEIEKAIRKVKKEFEDMSNYYKALPTLKHSLDVLILFAEQQLNNRWIPIRGKEDSPSENGDYQVTIKYENFSGVYVKTGIASCHDGIWTIHGSQPVITNKKIIAYKPLDESYQEASE